VLTPVFGVEGERVTNMAVGRIVGDNVVEWIIGEEETGLFGPLGPPPLGPLGPPPLGPLGPPPLGPLGPLA